jgi:hypothetical protein
LRRSAFISVLSDVVFLYAFVPALVEIAPRVQVVGPLSNSAFDERDPQLSPDGRWLAYSSDESGGYEIYVQSFTADTKVGGDKKRVSTNGGIQPTWWRDGQELFFVTDDGKMMSVAVKTGGAEFEYSTPKALFKTRMLAWSRLYHECDVTANGQRFLIGTLIGESKATPPTMNDQLDGGVDPARAPKSIVALWQRAGMLRSSCAGGAKEGSQGQAQSEAERAAPGGLSDIHALKARKDSPDHL